MKFSTKRGRPSQNKVQLTIIDGGANNAQPKLRKPIKINREAIDICASKRIISQSQHQAAMHFRWLYTLKFGAPNISAGVIDIDQIGGQKATAPEWQEQRERDYAMIVEKLRKIGALKIVLNVAVFNYFPRFLLSATISNRGQINFNYSELYKLRTGLEVIVEHIEKIKMAK